MGLPGGTAIRPEAIGARQGYVLHLEAVEAGVHARTRMGAGVLEVVASWPGGLGALVSADVELRSDSCAVEVTEAIMEGLARFLESRRQPVRSRIVSSSTLATLPEDEVVSVPAALEPPQEDAAVAWAGLVPAHVSVTVQLGLLTLAYRNADAAVVATIASTALLPPTSPGPKQPLLVHRHSTPLASACSAPLFARRQRRCWGW